MKRILTAVLAAVVMISAVTGVTVLTGRFKNSVVPVAHAIPLNASISLPSASSKLENAAGPAMTSGAALAAVVTPATPEAVETAVATIQRKAEEKAAAEAKAKAEAEAKAKAEAEAKAKAASQLMATTNSGKSLGSGVINGSDVRLRSDASTSSSILATLSKGASVTVLAESGSWYAVSYNGTAGYVAQQYVTLGDSLPADTGSADTSADTSTDTDSSTGSTDTSSTVPSGSYGSSAVSIAYQYMGVPYVYGGASPSGFDCSGFTMYVYAQLGVSLPHGATPQLNYGTYVSRSELQPGDLVFFSDGSYPASHVGIYVGDDQFIHASSSSSNGYCVCVSSLNSNYYSRNFVGGRRF